jgi:hypothetical protein
MYRVVGNSTERVPIPDLNDVIYYRQIKEYSDQEYETSKDLKKVISRGQVALLSNVKATRGSAEVIGQSAQNNLSVGDLKSAIRDVLPQLQPQQIDMKQALLDILPILRDAIRHEISKVSTTIQATAPGSTASSSFTDLTYVPTISTSGMKSNVEAKTQTDEEGVDDTLKLLRQLNLQQGK